MNSKLIKPISWLSAAILNFIFLALDFFTVKASYGKRSETEGTSGFDFIGEDFSGADAEIFKSLASISLVCIIILSVVLAIAAIIKLLPTFGVKLEILEKYDDLVEKISGIASKILGVFGILALISVFIFGVSNTESVFGIKITAGAGIGAYLLLIASVIPSTATKYAAKKLAKETAAEENNTPSEEA